MRSIAVRFLLASLALPTLASCATSDMAQSHPEARAYVAGRDASADLDAGLARAQLTGKNVLLVMGANWCHDSRALAGWLETPRFAALLADRYEVVYVNVGMPQTGDGHNEDIARRFGLDGITGTPAVLVIGPDGVLRNADTAQSWRNAASRSEDAIFDELASLAAEKAYSPSR